ncbi:MAG TPA: Sua5/YciO/YrdC/YwlC family protein, partial [Patescibacteria group bacterium]|nr:Sua5/YciO/YrdC/YwlC family protein [Patescibacteria group bacterium]
MATLRLSIHSQNPEPEKIRQVAQALDNGAVILYPTDTGFSLGCQLSNKEAIARLRAIRQLPETKALTFLCESLSNISEFAKVTNQAYRTIRHLVPGPYTFILPA